MASALNELNVGDVAEVGFTFRVDGTLTTPTSVTVSVRDPAGTITTFTEADPEVELGSTALSGDLATALGLTSAERAAGTGIVRVLQSLSAGGIWQFHCTGTGAAQGAALEIVRVRPQFLPWAS